MKTHHGVFVFALALAFAGCSGTAGEQAMSDSVRRLEMRVTAIEGAEMQPSPSPHVERSRVPSGPVALRAANLRAAADFLERAELARRGGDAGRAAALFQSAADEAGSDVLVDVEPLFKNRTAVQETTQKPAAATETAAPPASPASSTTPASSEVAPSSRAAPSHPRERERERDRDRDRASLGGAIRLEGPFASEGGMGVVLLSPASGRGAARAIHASVEQRNREFVPRLIAIPTGSTVSFPNADPVFHNVFSLSAARRFDLGLYKQGSKDVTFNKAGVVRVLCNLHAAMNAFIVVHDEPYAALIDRGGRFRFKELPPGRYKVRIWHERARDVTTRDLVLDAGPTELLIPVRADSNRDLGTDKEGKPRGPQKHS